MCDMIHKLASRTAILVIAVVIGVGGMVACNKGDRSASAQDRLDSDEIAQNEAANVTGNATVEQPAPVAHPGQQLVYNFDSDSAGQLPSKFHSARTGTGKQSRWAVTNDSTAPSKPNVVVQTSTDQTDYRFPLLISDEASFRDVDLSVKFKAVSGDIDRAAGLVFRLKDANNYYIARANALENNYRLYHVVNGHRNQFAGANLRIASGEWHELRVEILGERITCYYDGTKKIEATDSTFKEPGKVGLWTKADSVTYFDDFRVTAR
jgi:Domain of Unknown Function (DUF1080)